MNEASGAEKSSTFPAEIYRETVLSHVFADAQRLFLPSLLRVDLAHVLMLARQGILTQAQAAECLRAILSLDVKELQTARYDGSVEDLFFYVERKLAEIAGEENAGRIHTARSRNDLDLTMYRMVLRDHLLTFLGHSLRLRQVLLDLATKHRSAVMPAYTHNQPAQPTTLGHFLMAFVEILERDTERVVACYSRVNRSPLGACAITTTGFPIDRDMTAQALGFRGLVTNSYGAIASIDYVAETCSVIATAMVSMGRFVQEMLLWSTAEFGYLRLSEGYVQISSIMPQKRNPVPLEHCRILASRAMTEAQSVLGSLHNTPFADMNDGEDSLQPLVVLAMTDAQRSTRLLSGVLAEASFHTTRMRDKAAAHFLTATELADTLVRSCGLSFHRAHSIVSQAVRSAKTDEPDALARAVHAALASEGLALPLEAITTALDVDHFITVRSIPGGPAAEALEPELARARNQLAEDSEWLTAETQRLIQLQEELLKAARTASA